MTAVDNWKFEGYDETVSSWLTITPAQGGAGEIEVTFKAEAATESKTAELKLVCANRVQRVTVQQITAKVETPLSTCAEVIEGPDSKTYRVKGVVTAIANTTYGNWYLNDGTGEVYIYGTLDAKGAEKNFESLGIEVGDVVTCEGPKTTYNTTIELVNVTVIDIEKSLIKVESVEPEDAVIAKEGGDFKVELTCKGEGVSVEIPEAAKAWLSVTSITTSGSTASVVFTAAPNEGGDREATLVFKTSSKGEEYTAQTELKQEGSIIDATAAEINAAEDGATVYRYTGYITQDTGSDYGNIYVKDATGEVYCYGVLNEAGETKKWKEMGINVGDIVTVTGPKTSFNGAPQLKNVSVEKHIKVTDISLADFRNLPDDKNTWYRISGKVGKSTENGTKHDLENYGNFALFDGDTQVYVYGVKNGWGGPKGEFGKLGVKEGDDLTIVCYKTSFNGLIEADGCFYVSHTEGGSETPEPGPGGADYETTLVYMGVDAFYDDGIATINGVSDVKVLKFGTSKKSGECMVMIPAGSTKIVFYGIGWAGKDDVFTASFATFTQGEVTLKANPGATGNSPYTITATGSDYYTIEFNVPIEEEMPLTLKSTARCIIWGLQAKTE